jgi:hypothetical protein
MIVNDRKSGRLPRFPKGLCKKERIINPFSDLDMRHEKKGSSIKKLVQSIKTKRWRDEGIGR